MRKEELIKAIESFAPPELAEDWDNTGVQIDMGYPEVKRVLTALEITDEVIDEAMNAEADWIVTHHPLIFTSTSCIDYAGNTGRYIERLIRAGISVYSSHTAFDKAEGGNNDYLGKLEYTVQEPLAALDSVFAPGSGLLEVAYEHLICP